MAWDIREIMRGIVALRFGRKNINVEEGRKRLHNLLHKTVHDRLETYRQEGGWVNHTLFS